MHILLSGRGKLGKAVYDKCVSRGLKVTQFATPRTYDLRDSTPPISVVVYCGKQNGFEQILGFCEEYDIPFINASTDLGDLKPTIPKCVFVDAPNASIPMLYLMRDFPRLILSLKQAMEFRIAESHQSQKTKKSGTARAIAEMTNTPDNCISMIRDHPTQLALGVPANHLDGHAYHSFNFFGQDVEMQVTTKIHGRETYAEGLLHLANLVLENKTLRSGVHQASRLI